MKKVIKKEGNIVQAYCLGEANEVITQLMGDGKVKKISEDGYEIFSQEAVNEKGQFAKKGDYIKIDSAGFPYPNDREFFMENHIKISPNCFEQIPKLRNAWFAEDEICEEIIFLKEKKGLIIDPESNDKYFTAGILSAAKDAAIVFYWIERAKNGEIVDVDFNFVERKEFEKTYRFVE